MYSQFPNKLPYNEEGHLLGYSASPDTILEVFAGLLAKCTLPSPFAKGTKVAMNRWSPMLLEKPRFPMVTWRVIHTVCRPDRPREVRTRERQLGSQYIETYQQEFDNIVQFTCIAATQEEAAALEWWLVRQVYLYRHVLAEAGAQHVRYHEGRDDFLVGLPLDKYPARAVRFFFQTAMTFQVARMPLQKATLVTAIASAPITGQETLTKGDDTLADPVTVETIVSVTSEDGLVTYTPSFDMTSRLFRWTPDQPQPPEGAHYLVTYLYCGENPLIELV